MKLALVLTLEHMAWCTLKQLPVRSNAQVTEREQSLGLLEPTLACVQEKGWLFLPPQQDASELWGAPTPKVKELKVNPGQRLEVKEEATLFISSLLKLQLPVLTSVVQSLHNLLMGILAMKAQMGTCHCA